MCGNILDSVSNCEITQHAMDRIKKHSQLLRNRGIDERVVYNAIRCVCNKPNKTEKNKVRRGIFVSIYLKSFTLS
ncbi:hypothetical protein [Sulfuracidifex tepidarius]|nr:hypothetical protein [Sulfuracidifex tepidarius]